MDPACRLPFLGGRLNSDLIEEERMVELGAKKEARKEVEKKRLAGRKIQLQGELAPVSFRTIVQSQSIIIHYIFQSNGGRSIPNLSK